MYVKLVDGTYGTTEEEARVGDTVTLEICDDNGNNIEVTGVVAKRCYRGQLLPT
ncbi:MAG: hypothetical protein NUV58_04890 [Candidatus Roizmanbacteria bacterium]|nr:hypothetical protein [Candidatus Roizmanbacteria bacterium]